MSRPICSRCAKRHGCQFRQPGTWAIDCESYQEEPAAAGVVAAPEAAKFRRSGSSARAESGAAGRPGAKS